MTFRQQLLSSPNCCLLSSARGCHREQQIVVDVAQLVGPSSLFMTPWLFCRILTASGIHCVVLSDSRAMIVASFQLMTWFSWLTLSVIADLFCSDCDCFLKLLVYLRPSCASTSFWYSFIRTPKLHPVSLWRPLAEDSKQQFEEDSSCCRNVTENLVSYLQFFGISMFSFNVYINRWAYLRLLLYIS